MLPASFSTDNFLHLHSPSSHYSSSSTSLLLSSQFFAQIFNAFFTPFAVPVACVRASVYFVTYSSHLLCVISHKLNKKINVFHGNARTKEKHKINVAKIKGRMHETKLKLLLLLCCWFALLMSLMLLLLLRWQALHKGDLYLTGIQVTFTLVVDQQAHRNKVLYKKIQYAGNNSCDAQPLRWLLYRDWR